jgi:transient receptor potential cation channel subfamily M protein 3
MLIKQLDFKSKEELELMPQTEEEHLENKNEKKNEDKDTEVSFRINHPI